MWRDLLLFGEHTWGSSASGSDADGAAALAEWRYKRRFLDDAAAAADAQVAAALLRMGLSIGGSGGAGRVVFNASSWARSDVLRVPDGAARRLAHDGREWPAVDLPDGSALVVAREVPALGYLALTESERATNPPHDDGAALEAHAGGFHLVLTNPTVEFEVPLGRMTVERDQQHGSCRDWYCHAHWVWLHDAAGGILWSGPDTPLFTLNDIFRGQWRRRIEPDGTLFAYVLHNYWPTNFAARQGGQFSFRYRISALPPGGDRAEPARRGWAA